MKNKEKINSARTTTAMISPTKTVTRGGDSNKTSTKFEGSND